MNNSFQTVLTHFKWTIFFVRKNCWATVEKVLKVTKTSPDQKFYVTKNFVNSKVLFSKVSCCLLNKPQKTETLTHIYFIKKNLKNTLDTKHKCMQLTYLKNHIFFCLREYRTQHKVMLNGKIQYFLRLRNTNETN